MQCKADAAASQLDVLCSPMKVCIWIQGMDVTFVGCSGVSHALEIFDLGGLGELNTGSWCCS